MINATTTVTPTPITPPPLPKNITIQDIFALTMDLDYDAGFYSSIIDSFLMILIAELGDKTFIMLFILQLKTNKASIFYSSLFAELFMNICAIGVGYMIDLFLYKNYIDYLGICFYTIYGYVLVLGSMVEKNRTFANELAVLEDTEKENFFIEQQSEKDIQEQKEKEKDQVIKQPKLITKSELHKQLTTIVEVSPSEETTKVFHINRNSNSPKKRKKMEYDSIKKEDDLSKDNMNNTLNTMDDNNNNDLSVSIDNQNEQENQNIDIGIFWYIFMSMAASEFGDTTQFIALTMSSIYNVNGIIIGSSLALFCSCYLGVYWGKQLSGKLNVKVIDFLLGITMLLGGLRIFLGKRHIF